LARQGTPLVAGLTKNKAYDFQENFGLAKMIDGL
jgi:hypothetical protein